MEYLGGGVSEMSYLCVKTPLKNRQFNDEKMNQKSRCRGFQDFLPRISGGRLLNGCSKF